MIAPFAAALAAFLLPGGSEFPRADPVTQADTQSYRSEDVRYPGDSLTLAALLMIPQRSQPCAPAAVIIQGSGNSDRSNQWARSIAELLVGEGMVVLLTDKRGSGASEGDWRTSDFHALARDALAGVKFLQGRDEVDSSRVGLAGLSQGGWIAPLAAAQSGSVAFVINISGAAVGFAEQSFHEMANTARQAGLAEPEVREVLQLNRAAGEYLITGNWARYQAARDAALQSSWRRIAEGFPGSPAIPVWTFLRGVGQFDPMPYWIQLTQPVLVLYGADDERDNVPVAESVRRLEHAFGAARKDNYRIVVVPGAGHGFIDPERHELMGEFVEVLRTWVGELLPEVLE
ncbi:MAG TPA: alpha/beta fold hydrolase [Gemmatimonadaceae bacterium]|nr:alpha/beta fold hydrolase [Gemmatimonadaceae bacterium]